MAESSNIGATGPPENYGAVTDHPEERSLEDIYLDLGLGRAQYTVWAAMVLIVASDCGELVVTSILIPYLTCEWDLGLLFQVAISASVFFCYALGGLFFGSLSDKLGRKKVLLFSTSVLLCASISSAFSLNKWMFLVSRMVVGLCIGANYPTTFVFACEVVSSRHKEAGAFLLLFFEKLAMVLVALMAYIFLNAVGWRIFLLIVAVPILIAIGFIVYIPESPRYLVASGRREDAIATVRKLFAWNGKEFPENTTIKTYDNVERGKLFDLFKPKYLRETVLLSAIYFGNIFIIFGIIVFLPLALTAGFCGASKNYKTSDTCKTMDQGDLWDLAVISASGMLAVSVSVVMAKKIGRTCPMKCFAVCSFILATTLFFCIHILVTKTIFFLLKFFTISLNTILWIVIPEFYPTVIRNTATGFINFWGKTGGALSAGLVYLVFYVSPYLVVGMFAGAALVSMVAVLFWNTETRDNVFEEITQSE